MVLLIVLSYHSGRLVGGGPHHATRTVGPDRQTAIPSHAQAAGPRSAPDKDIVAPQLRAGRHHRPWMMERAEFQNGTWRRRRVARRIPQSTREDVRAFLAATASLPRSSRLESEPFYGASPAARPPGSVHVHPTRLDSQVSPTRRASSPAGIRPAYVGRARSCQVERTRQEDRGLARGAGNEPALLEQLVGTTKT